MISISPIIFISKSLATLKPKKFYSTKKALPKLGRILQLDPSDHEYKHVYDLSLGRLILGDPRSKSNNLGVPGLSLPNHIFIETIYNSSTKYASIEINPSAPLTERVYVMADCIRQLSPNDPIVLSKESPTFVYIESSQACFQVSYVEGKLVLKSAKLPVEDFHSGFHSIKRSEDKLRRSIQTLSCKTISPSDDRSGITLPVEFLGGERNVSFTVVSDKSENRNGLQINCPNFPGNARITFSLDRQNSGTLPKVRFSIGAEQGEIPREFNFFCKANSHLHGSELNRSVGLNSNTELITPPSSSNQRPDFRPAGIIEFVRGALRYSLELSLGKDSLQPEVVNLTLKLQMSPDRRRAKPNHEAARIAERISMFLGQHYLRPIELPNSHREGLIGQIQVGAIAHNIPQNLFISWPSKYKKQEAWKENYAGFPVLFGKTLDELKMMDDTQLSSILYKTAKGFFPYYRDPNNIRVGDLILMPEGRPMETFAQFETFDRSKIHISDIYVVREIHSSYQTSGKRFICESTDNLAVLVYNPEHALLKMNLFPQDTVQFNGTLFQSFLSSKRQELEHSGLVAFPVESVSQLTAVKSTRNHNRWPIYSHSLLPSFGIGCSSTGHVAINITQTNSSTSLYRVRSGSYTKITSRQTLETNDSIIACKADTNPQEAPSLLVAKVVKVPYVASRSSAELNEEERRFTLDMFVI